MMQDAKQQRADADPAMGRQWAGNGNGNGNRRAVGEEVWSGSLWLWRSLWFWRMGYSRQTGMECGSVVGGV